jgi:hypothetical protein
MKHTKEWQDLIKKIEEKVLSVKEDIKETKADPNSYGAGYDSGYLQALTDIKDIIEDLD